MVEHWSAKSKGLRFDSSEGLTVFPLSHTDDKTKNIFLYFFTELKTYHLSYSFTNNMLQYAPEEKNFEVVTLEVSWDCIISRCNWLSQTKAAQSGLKLSVFHTHVCDDSI